ncbi:Exportin-T [Toxocara canis]|uniref:Exportin-T n=1 Tax=Toxocara canis TaxID=6265 RepID=A0A0B2VM39_TOXCA|nr:Exportin-T [Toxocara canis]
MVSLTALTDPAQHYQLFEYLQKLKADPNGWRNCIENIVQQNFSGVEEHFVLLQVIESYLANKYVKDDDGQEAVRLWMSSWLQTIASSESPPNYLSNKMAQLFALVFAADFPVRWPQYMHEVFLQRLDSPAVVLFFLRTLMAIDSEVVNREIQRTKEVFDRNTRIKDAMRDLCVVDVANVWTNILSTDENDKAPELCLDVIGCYVDWIDIELVVNDTMVPLIIGCLNDEKTSESAVRAICAIIEKGMDAQKKFALVSALYVLLQQNGSLSATPESDAEAVAQSGMLLNAIGCALIVCHTRTLQSSYKRSRSGELITEASKQESDAEAVAHSGMLLNAIGCALIVCHTRFDKDNEMERRKECDALLENTLTCALQCFSHENVDASQTVVEFLREYVSMLKGEPLSSQHEAYLSELVGIIINRWVMPSFPLSVI